MGISPAKDAALSTCHGWSRQRNKISGQAKGCTCTEPRTRLSGRDETVFCLSLFWPTLRVFAGQLFESAGAVVCESPSLVDLRAPSVDPHGRILPATVKRRPSPGPAARLSARPTLICAPYLSLSLCSAAVLPCLLVRRLDALFAARSPRRAYLRHCARNFDPRHIPDFAQYGQAMQTCQ